MPTVLAAPARPGTALAAYLAALNVKTGQLAEVCQVHPKYMSAVVHGHSRPSRRLRRSISEALSVPESSLWPTEGDIQP